MTECSTKQCLFEAKYDGQCALHCVKGARREDLGNGVSDDFFEQLAEYVFEQIKQDLYENEFKEIDLQNLISKALSKERNIKSESKLQLEAKISNEKKNIISIIKGQSSGNDVIRKKISQLEVHFYDIYFPKFESDNHQSNYCKILSIFKNVTFIDCQFNSNYLNINTGSHFEFCTFNDWWDIYYSTTPENTSKVKFLMCDFIGSVRCNELDNFPLMKSMTSGLFSDCNFHADLTLINTDFKLPVFVNKETFKQSVNNLKIKNCTFEGRFLLNNLTVNDCSIIDSEFKSKSEIKYNIIENFELQNTNFVKLFDAYNSKFHSFKITKCIFDDFTGFEKCEFGVKDDVDKREAEFEYATFLNFTNFRKAEFYNGLNLEHTNLKETPNFLKSNINETQTNRETFRIIKHSFDKVGNHIEANKYFSYEMKKYKEELKNAGSKSELIIYWFNEKISNFGLSYLKPLGLMIFSALIYYGLVLGFESNLLYKFSESTNSNIAVIADHINSFAKGIPPYSKFLKEGMEFMTLIFHIFFLVCAWQFIVAVKRRTKR